MTPGEFEEMALSFPGTVSQPHFERTAFKITGKRIFATLHKKSESVNILLTPEEQKVFCSIDESIYPILNKWGLKGWTTFELKKAERPVILDALNSAYENVLKK
ncbi:MmcQ/YjbR family DNA-binding protein [Ginsengibacter hankyongi]|uniref:MmcQ/YjbR family DNA-binding protein n=1 Tax=Ginsengibacter hankyongi TaxID=2607284 RepID=A0A5J5ILZ7_9BACT|nr:MmcQ/YjbR family DNA-binding protein [Ginsengibacter hankyongi]KAA9042125.1 MmcQ/YjbR family DNA-binding protein [Ginsengibacter hankyongi]